MKKNEKNELISIGTDLGEIALDSILKDGLFKDIPFLSIGISVDRLMQSASDRILLAKIIQFINDLNLKSQQEIDEFKYKYLADKDYKNIGSKILLALNLADNELKIKWLAKSLRLFIDKKISKNEFQRISSIVNRAYVEDVRNITVFDLRSEITAENDLIDTYILDHLFSIGLLESHGFDGGDASGKDSGTIYALNKFGKLIKEKII